MEKKIIVAGDVAIDWLQWSVEAEGKPAKNACQRLNWKLFDGTKSIAVYGGALMLRDMVEAGLGKSAEVKSHKHQPNPATVPQNEVIHSISKLKRFNRSMDGTSGKPVVFRVDEYCGYSGPTDIVLPLPLEYDPPKASAIILDDAGNGFRHKKDFWPVIIKENKPCKIVIVKMSRPLCEGDLWAALSKRDKQNLIIVTGATDLREFGVNLSLGLSWERTSEDFVREIEYNNNLKKFITCENFIIRLGEDGAIHYSYNNGSPVTTLYYDSRHLESGYASSLPGSMQALSSAFVAGLASKVCIQDEISPESVKEGIKQGIISSRALYRLGYGEDENSVSYPVDKIFDNNPDDVRTINDIKIPSLSELLSMDGGRWTILGSLEKRALQNSELPENIFYRWVDNGKGEYIKKPNKELAVYNWIDKVAFNTVFKGPEANFQGVPYEKIGKLKIVDRMEMEGYNSIRNLLTNYISGNNLLPISIAVFGQPGSGKSFGIKQLAKSVAGDRIEEIPFNLSQFVSVEDLVAAFNSIQNLVLKGKIPLVIFDEFDSDYKGIELGWLKYFLAPMQDGKFKDGESLHTIGNAIFVFAGGTKHSLSEFIVERPKPGSDGNFNRDAMAEWDKFRKAKGPDFLSRLRGYVNIMGPNKVGAGDEAYRIRRAMILRSIFEYKLGRKLFAGNGELKIQSEVLKALINVREYKHGIRSMEAIIEMSRLGELREFAQASLPPKEQIELHVDSEMFYNWISRYILYGDAVDVIAMDVHEKYRSQEIKRAQKAIDTAKTKDKGKLKQEKEIILAKKSMVQWDNLSEYYKEDNRQFLDAIPGKVMELGYKIKFTGSQKLTPQKFSKAEIIKLAKVEHERWKAAKESQGWTLAVADKPGEEAKRDDSKKLHPLLVPWDDLPKSEKEKNMGMIERIPGHLATAGLELYKFKRGKSRRK